MYAMNTLYKKKNFKIYSAGKNSYIVHNTHMNFETHHTHINNFNTCKYIIDLCIHKTVPHHLSEYLLVSITRLSNDKDYIAKIKDKLNKMKGVKNNAQRNNK